MKRLLPFLPPQSYGVLPTVVVLAVVLLAGSRLIYLSVQHHAAAAREAAATVAATFAGKIESPLQKLLSVAAQQATMAAKSLPSTPTAASLGPLLPAAHTFWMVDDDKVLGARLQETATANGIASEWRSAESTSGGTESAILGPIRLGSDWLVATRFPMLPQRSVEASALRGWAVAYANLDELIAASHLGRLIDMGYDFELSQVEVRSARTRSFVSSSNDLLTDAVAARIRLPTAAAIPGSYLQIAIRPHTGWYPATLLVSQIGLLVFLAWLLAFGTYDLTHALQRSRSALAAARRRLRGTNERLAWEMQQRLDLQQTFDHARFHDAFTGLPNRRYFMDQLDRALRDLRTNRRQRIAVIIVNITRFKLVNDTLGHTAGDELMVQAARRFEKSTAALEGTLARWSGDQFALLILNIASSEAARDVAVLLREDLRLPIELRRQRLAVAATVGLTCVESGQQRAEEVVREADIALSVAKRQERANIVVYSPTMAGQAANLVSLEADLHVALEAHQLRLVFQPIVDLRTFRMVGAEALLRWRHPVEKVLTPDRFLSIAEEAGLMVPITHWIILRVVKLAAEWSRRLSTNERFFISINLSPLAVRDPMLGEFVESLLRETQLPPSLLKFELTESALIGNVAAARETLERLHTMGIQLMLDDFGTGYSSLSYLQLFPFDFVKIDRPFVNRTAADSANTGMMAAMMQIAGSLKLTAIAEIIETEAAATALREMGCDYGQGYYFSEPIEAEPALQRLRSQEPFRPTRETSATAVVRPMDEDPSSTSILPVFPDPFHPPQSTSATVKVRPLEQETSATVKVRPLEQETSATVKVRPLEEDGSPTVLIATSSADYGSDDDDDT